MAERPFGRDAENSNKRLLVGKFRLLLGFLQHATVKFINRKNGERDSEFYSILCPFS